MIKIYFHLLFLHLEQFWRLNVPEQFHLLGRIAQNELFAPHDSMARNPALIILFGPT